MKRQETLSKSIKTRGIGLHTGVDVNLTLKPAPPNTGYVFIRTDLDDFEIPASVEYISHCSYATTLLRKGVVLSTCEHILSALLGSGVDNCFIELDSIEVPILDGSSEAFVHLIEKAGLEKQNSPKRFFKVKKRVEFEQNGRKMSVEPSEKFEIECLIDFPHPFINKQAFTFVLGNGSFGKEIAAARTFGFATEIEMLRKANLAQGGSLENAIVLRPDKILFRELLVRALFVSGRGEDAIPHLEEILKNRPENATNLALMGEALKAAGRAAEARSAFERALPPYIAQCAQIQ